MSYNPKIHHRRSIRLKGYDYSQNGLYFITICADRRGNPSRLPFGDVVDGEMILNEFGRIAYNEWIKLAERFTNFELDVFQIMPNHMHGIIVLNDIVGAGITPAQNGVIDPNDVVAQNGAVAQNKTLNTEHGADIISRAGASPAPTTTVAAKTDASVSDIVGAYKSLVANACLEIHKSNHVGAGFTPAQIPMMGKLWQRDFYEHIIRDEQSYETISNYIINNPAKWNDDKFYTKQ